VTCKQSLKTRAGIVILLASGLVMLSTLFIVPTVSCQAPTSTTTPATPTTKPTTPTTEPPIATTKPVTPMTEPITAKEAYDLALSAAREKMAEAYIAYVRAGTRVPSYTFLDPGASVSITTPQVPEGRSRQWDVLFCPVALPQDVVRLSRWETDMIDVNYLIVSINEGGVSAEYDVKGMHISYPFDPELWQIDSPEAVKIAQEIADTEEKQSELRFILSEVILYDARGFTSPDGPVPPPLLTWTVSFFPKSRPQKEGLEVDIDATTGEVVGIYYSEYTWT